MFDVKPITSPLPTDCGPTCLKMLLSYYGIDIDLDQLIEECRTRFVGCSAGDLKRAGTAHGLDVHVFKMDSEETIRQDRPSIVWWKYNHWIVCCGQDDAGNVVICNPDRGRYRMSQGLFKALYSGVALFNGNPKDLPEVES